MFIFFHIPIIIQNARLIYEIEEQIKGQLS